MTGERRATGMAGVEEVEVDVEEGEVGFGEGEGGVAG